MATMQSHSTGIHNLDFDKYKSIEIPLPPLQEQQRIVEKLDNAFAKIDAIKANAEKNLQEAKDLFNCAILKTFSATIDVTSKRLSEVSSIVSGFAFKSIDFCEHGDYQVIRIGNVKQGLLRTKASPVYINHPDEITIRKAGLKKKDLVVTQTGTKYKRDYGFVSMIETEGLLLNQRVARIRFFDKEILPDWFQFFSYTEQYKSQFFAQEGGTVGQGNVGISALTDMIVPIPNDKNQAKIILEGLVALKEKCSSCESLFEQQKQECDALKQALLRKAFNGEL